MDIWKYGKETLSQVIRPAVTKQKIFQQQPQEAGTKRSRAALGNITNQTKNATLLAVPTKQPKSAKKSKIAPSKEQPEETKQSTKQNGKRNSYSSRRKRKSSVSDSVVPHFADMDLSSTPSTTPVLSDSNKRTQSQDLIAMEQMRMETTTIELTEDKMEEEILLDEDEELSDEEEEEERARDRDAKRTDKIQRQRLQQQELAATTSSTIISNPTQSITSPNEMRMAVSMEKEDTDMLPEGAQNIDALDESDPQWVTAYVNEIYENLKVNERKHLARITNYIDTVQKAVTPSMRGVLVDWLVEVAEEYELSSETLYLAVNFLDRFLSIQTVDRRKFQLVGVACMLIASKYEEIYAPAIDEFVYISANTYKREEILLMEILILNTLGFELTAATAKVFLRRFLKAAGADLTLAFLSSYLAELTLQEFTFVKYPPSLIAASAVFLALRTLGREPWTPTLQYYTKYTLENETFQQCIHELYKVHISAPENTLKAIYEKYSDTRFRKVAKIPPPIVDPQSEN